jgi:hypothetical protein
MDDPKTGGAEMENRLHEIFLMLFMLMGDLRKYVSPMVKYAEHGTYYYLRNMSRESHSSKERPAVVPEAALHVSVKQRGLKEVAW